MRFLRQRMEERLRAVCRRRLLATNRLPFESVRQCGYVVGVGTQWCAWLLVEDGSRFGGIACLRITDVRELGPDPHPAFVRAALRWRGERRPRLPRWSLDDTAGTLASVARAFPLVTIHRDKVRPNTCQIGRIVGLDRTAVHLVEIEPGATWDPRPTAYRLRDITRIEGGGPYEAALHAIGGEPPAASCPAVTAPARRTRAARRRA